MKKLLSYYLPSTPSTLVYMLQQFEYSPQTFRRWINKMPDLTVVRKRGRLHTTKRAKLMLAIAVIAYLSPVVLGIYLMFVQSIANVLFVFLAPLFAVSTLIITTWVLQKFLVDPKQQAEIVSAYNKLQNIKATRIAVLGSYGKTTMKELLTTVLSEGKRVAATPGNKNVLISHARWVISALEGNEDVLIFEYGEGQPGDIDKLAGFSFPNIAVATGIAPAHLDMYPDMDAIAEDFGSIGEYLPQQDVYVFDSELLKSVLPGNVYNMQGVQDWKASNIIVGFDGTSFRLTHGKETLELHTSVLGSYQIGPLSAVVAIAHRLGLTNEQIISGVAKTTPYEHRMQPRQLNGAWIIDDTYNGNIEGMRAGLELLNTLPGKRKIYVTPGLVDQGVETERVHIELGTLIAKAKPDKVVLMQNSVTSYIKTGLEAGEYSGEVATEINPLEYYTNLEHFLASGDVIMLQNDWPDSYQ